MKILSLHRELELYLKKMKLKDKFIEQKRLFEQNPLHSSLNTELMEPRHLRIWSFRINRKYRAIFIFHERNIVEIIDINNHYK